MYYQLPGLLLLSQLNNWLRFMEKKQVSLEELNCVVAEFVDSTIQRAREIRDLDIEAIVDLVIKRTLEAFPPKQPSAYEDKPVVFWFDRDSKWFKRYPLLHAKASQRSRCLPPDFTAEELAERADLAELLLWHKVLLDHGSYDAVKDDLSELPADSYHASLHILLFMLARCGDESAFLELLSRDTSFMSHPFFSHSLEGWVASARQGDASAKEILGRVMEVASQSVLASAEARRKGRPPSNLSIDRSNRFIESVKESPDEKYIKIYRQMAQEELTEDRQRLQEKGLDEDDFDLEDVSTKANAIKKTIHRENLHMYVQGLMPDKWDYTYLKEHY